MKFDKIIMNPPYDRDLHLQILGNVVINATNTKWCLANLSPASWYMAYMNYDKPSSLFQKVKAVGWTKFVNSIELIPQTESIKLFEGARFPTMLGVYSLKSDNSNPKYFDSITIDSDKAKLMLRLKGTFTKDTLKMHLDENKKDGIRVSFKDIGGGAWTAYQPHTFDFFRSENDVFIDGLDEKGQPWYTHWVKNQYSKLTDYLPYSIEFKSVDDARNFIKFYNLDWMKWYIGNAHIDMHIHPEYYPMPDLSIQWTNAEFEKFYNLPSLSSI